MGFFGFVFWMFMIWMLIRFWHRREARRMVGPRGYAPNSGWYDDTGESELPATWMRASKNARSG